MTEEKDHSLAQDSSSTTLFPAQQQNGRTSTQVNGHSTIPAAQDKQLQNDDVRYRLPFLQWLQERFTWSFFTATQSTGGIATLLSECPKQFRGLETIGIIIFIFNIVLFSTFTACMALRWYSAPAKIKHCFTTPPECYFFGSYWLSAATLILNMQRYGVPHTGPWLITAIRVLFWMYAAISLLVTSLHMVVICKYTKFVAVQFAPPMIILILTAMLTGTVAAAIATTQPPHERVAIMVAGVAYQGLGWIVCMIFLTLCFANLLENGWPAPSLRPGLFILVGTSGFTIVALIGNARAAPINYGYFARHPTAAEVLLILATWVGIFLWLFSFWVFALAFWINILELVVKREGRWQINMTYNNTAWGGIFPNVGWTLGTIYIGQELESEGILWVTVAMIILLVVFWLLDLFFMFKTAFKSMFIDSRIKLG